MKNHTALVGIAFLLAVSVAGSCDNKRQKEHAVHKQNGEVYTCPMHPEIIRNEPGDCPICGMKLIKKESHATAIQDVELNVLLQPVNEFVVSSISVTTMGSREELGELAVVGTVSYDTRRVASISSRVSGRIERLYIRYKYQPIKKGQKVMDVYSPGLMTAQQNLLFLLRNDPENSVMIRAAKDRLLLLGMSSAQVSELVKSGKSKQSISVYSGYSGFVTELDNASIMPPTGNMQESQNSTLELAIKEGMYLQAGQPVFTIYDPSAAWILLDIFPAQQNLVKVGDAVKIVPETAPSRFFRAKIAYLEPVFRAGNKTLTARVHFNNASMALPIGSRVTANIYTANTNADWLPKEAILSLGREKIVFRKEAGGFRAHKVVTGIEANKFIQITAGLSSKDSVAVNANYLVDNEAFIKAI